MWLVVLAAAALGIGSMIGAGIFALMGEAGAIAGSAVYLSFIAAGAIALLSGYSMARLGAHPYFFRILSCPAPLPGTDD